MKTKTAVSSKKAINCRRRVPAKRDEYLIEDMFKLVTDGSTPWAAATQLSKPYKITPERIRQIWVKWWQA
jgi:hypothetical protein